MKFFTRHKRKVRVAIDIGSDSLKTIVFEIPEDGGGVRGMRKIVTKLNPELEASRVISSLHEVVFSIIKREQSAPENIMVGIGPNIADASLQFWNIPLDEHARISSQETLKTLFAGAFERSRPPGAAVLAYPVGLLANGYVAEPAAILNMQPGILKEIGFSTVMFSFPKQVANAMVELRQMFGGISVEFIPLVVSMKEAVIDALQAPDTFLVDVGGSSTLLLFIKGGRLAHFSTFPIGAHHFSYTLSAARRNSFRDSEDTKSRYVQGFIEESEASAIRHLFGQVSNDWKTAFLKELESFYPHGPLPEYLFLTGGGSYIPEVRAAVYAPEISKNFSHATALKVRILKGPVFFQSESLQGMIQGPEDANLAALIHYSLYHKPLF